MPVQPDAAEALLLPPRTTPYLWVVPVILLEFLILGLPASVMPGLLSDALGHNAVALLGISAGVKGLLSFLTAPVVGAVSDRFGRRWPILITSFGTAVPYLLLAVEPSLTVFLAVNAACGVFLCTFSLVMAYIADCTLPHTRTRAYGVALAMFGLSMSGGPFAGTYLVAAYGERALWLSCAGLAALNLAYVALLLPESRPPAAAGARWPTLLSLLPRTACSSRAVRVLAAVALLDECAEQLLVQLLLQYLTERFRLDSLASACLLAEVGVVSGLSLTLVLWLLRRRLDDLSVLRLGLGFNCLSIVALGVAWLPWQPFVAVLGCLVAFLVFPALASLVAAAVPEATQGEAQGAIAGVKSLADGVSPLLYGPLFGLFRGTALPGGPFVVAGGLVGVALLGLCLPSTRATLELLTPRSSLRGGAAAGHLQ